MEVEGYEERGGEEERRGACDDNDENDDDDDDGTSKTRMRLSNANAIKLNERTQRESETEWKRAIGLTDYFT